MTIEIVFALNHKVIVGLLAAMNSVVKNAARPEQVRFNIIIPPGEQKQFSQQLQAAFPNPDWRWRLQEYTPPQYMCDYLDQRFGQMSAERRHARHMLYSRFYLKDIFPDLDKIIYLDVDLVVLQDIAQLYNSLEFSPESFFAAVPHFYPAAFYFTQPWKKRQRAAARQFINSFNAGVQFTDLRYWQSTVYQQLQEYLDWAKSEDYRTFQLDDELFLNLLFRGYIQLDRKWNCCGYGNQKWVTQLIKKPLSQIAILHWSGGFQKPWENPDIVYGSVWQQYALPLLVSQ